LKHFILCHLPVIFTSSEKRKTPVDAALLTACFETISLGRKGWEIEMNLRTAILAGHVAVLGGVAHAQDLSVDVAVRAPVSEAAVAAMHADIREAARDVCGAHFNARVTLSERRRVRACVADAMDRAIEGADIAALEQYHDGVRGDALLAYLEPAAPQVAAATVRFTQE
jgi:UrcA family protein